MAEKKETEAQRQAEFDRRFYTAVKNACNSGLLTYGSAYLNTPGSNETVRVFDLLKALDTGLRVLLKAQGYSPHQAMVHGRVLPLSTDPYEVPEEE